MTDYSKSVQNILEYTNETDKRQLIGKPSTAAKLFQNLFQQNPLPHKLVLFTTDNGLVLAAYPPDLHNQLRCRTLNFKDLATSDTDLIFFENIPGYYIITSGEKEYLSQTETFATEFLSLLNILEDALQENNSLLTSLDSVNKSISIYDRNANLLFANRNFCNYLYTQDRNTIIGKNIEDIIQEAGTTVQSIDTNTTRLKMHEVLEKGEEVIDWEVRVTSERGDTLLVGNDMYPVRNTNGEITGMVEITHSRQQLLANARKLAGLSAEYSFKDIIGTSSITRDTIRTAKDYANSPLSLLITGESGVGKELFAQSVHNYSSRRKGPFVALNCASFPENLIESELFGYVGGAFTGASKGGQTGKFELADGGTLFLDEVGELPYHFQSKLLRVLETWTVTRIGSSKPSPVNVRLIAATNRDLKKMVEEGLFRQDLFYRLQILNIEIPPLRERRDDILSIAEVLLQQSKNPDSPRPKVLTDDACALLSAYDWPGNVRELRNVLYRAALLTKTDKIGRDILEASISAGGGKVRNSLSHNMPADYQSAEDRLAERRADIDKANANLLKEAMDITGGNRTKAADLLEISRNTFYRMLKKYNIE